MKIIDLSAKHESLYFLCLEDWSDEIKEAGNHKEIWYNKMKDKGLRVKLAIDENNEVGGMIQYVPIELSPAEGQDLYFINCIWVHGYKKGRGNFQKKGMGRALLAAAEEDVKSLQGKGIVARGVPLPFWMKASWFKKYGYKKIDQQGFLGQVLLWKPFTNEAKPPSWVKLQKKPVKEKGKVTITCFKNGWCPAMNLTYERAKRAVEELYGDVIFNEIDTFDRSTFNEWGICDGLYINGKAVRVGPPPSYDKIKNKIKRQIKRGKSG